jgi:hypothetical protein
VYGAYGGASKAGLSRGPAQRGASRRCVIEPNHNPLRLAAIDWPNGQSTVTAR